MGIFSFWETQTEDEYVQELARDAAKAGFKAVEVTALTADGDCYSHSAIKGEGLIGPGVDEWSKQLAEYTRSHADIIDPEVDASSQSTSWLKSLFGG